MRAVNITPFHALFDGEKPSPEGIRRIKRADVIRFERVVRDSNNLLCGRDAVMDALQSQGNAAVRMMVIGVDDRTDQLGKLVALIRSVKGIREYYPTPTIEPAIESPRPAAEIVDPGPTKLKPRKLLRKIRKRLAKLRAKDPNSANWILQQLNQG